MILVLYCALLGKEFDKRKLKNKCHSIVNLLRQTDRKREETGDGGVRCIVFIIITGVSRKNLLPSASRQCPLILLVFVCWTHVKALATEQSSVMVSGLLEVPSRGK
jgi:hypothetical protein